MLINAEEAVWLQFGFTGIIGILLQISGNITHNEGGDYA
jgi:hypothetical protein